MSSALRCPMKGLGSVFQWATQALRAVHDAGFALRLLTPERESLETVFLDLTGASDPHRAEPGSAQSESGTA